jgi:hypothetical protein
MSPTVELAVICPALPFGNKPRMALASIVSNAIAIWLSTMDGARRLLRTSSMATTTQRRASRAGSGRSSRPGTTAISLNVTAKDTAPNSTGIQRSSAATRSAATAIADATSAEPEVARWE